MASKLRHWGAAWPASDMKNELPMPPPESPATGVADALPARVVSPPLMPAMKYIRSNKSCLSSKYTNRWAKYLASVYPPRSRNESCNSGRSSHIMRRASLCRSVGTAESSPLLTELHNLLYTPSSSAKQNPKELSRTETSWIGGAVTRGSTSKRSASTITFFVASSSDFLFLPLVPNLNNLDRPLFFRPVPVRSPVRSPSAPESHAGSSSSESDS
mmetsp:Transcript_42732/g.124182  ORF Transcript_42732/g.124182 Transcript_42732/m.124182 type:complete len:215 (+) Transcript_42732:649-1293(+)